MSLLLRRFNRVVQAERLWCALGMKDCNACIIKNRAICADLGLNELHFLASLAPFSKQQKGQEGQSGKLNAPNQNIRREKIAKWWEQPQWLAGAKISQNIARIPTHFASDCTEASKPRKLHPLGRSFTNQTSEKHFHSGISFNMSMPAAA